MIKYIPFILCLLMLPIASQAHPGGLDALGGHTNKKTSQYHCHKPSCTKNHQKSDAALHEAKESGRSYSLLYNRDDWPHWIDEDRDCQDTRAEVLIATSLEPVKFKRNKGCVVTWGKWIDPYTGKTFTKASDLDIDHIVPLSYAHKHGAANWSREQKRAFANDPDNLIPVDDETNQEVDPIDWTVNLSA